MIENTNRKDVYVTNGTTIYWPFTFQPIEKDGSDLALYETNLTTGATTKIETNLTIELENFRIKYPRTGLPRPTGYKITVARVTPRTQGINLGTQSFDPKNMERGLDKLTAQVQEIDETVSRAAVADISTEGVNFAFPAPVGGKVLGWNPEGTGLINLSNTTFEIEADMLAATTAAQEATTAVNNLITTAFETDQTTIKEATHATNANMAINAVRRRQTVTTGIIDGSGLSAFLNFNGLTVNIVASENVPVICTLANGNDPIKGELNYLIAYLTTVAAWTSLPTNKAFLQLYIDYDPVLEAISYGYTEFETIYSTIFPNTPSINQHLFDLNTYKMKRYNGTAWENKIRLMVGECVTGASGITSVTTYALNGMYRSGVRIAGDGTIGHFIGTPPLNMKCLGMTSGTGNMYEYQANKIGNLTKTHFTAYGTSGNLVNGSAATHFQVFLDRGW